MHPQPRSHPQAEELPSGALPSVPHLAKLCKETKGAAWTGAGQEGRGGSKEPRLALAAAVSCCILG